jgi:hypothetical protein
MESIITEFNDETYRATLSDIKAMVRTEDDIETIEELFSNNFQDNKINRCGNGKDD